MKGGGGSGGKKQEAKFAENQGEKCTNLGGSRRAHSFSRLSFEWTRLSFVLTQVPNWTRGCASENINLGLKKAMVPPGFRSFKS